MSRRSQGRGLGGSRAGAKVPACPSGDRPVPPGLLRQKQVLMMPRTVHSHPRGVKSARRACKAHVSYHWLPELSPRAVSHRWIQGHVAEPGCKGCRERDLQAFSLGRLAFLRGALPPFGRSVGRSRQVKEHHTCPPYPRGSPSRPTDCPTAPSVPPLLPWPLPILAPWQSLIQLPSPNFSHFLACLSFVGAPQEPRRPLSRLPSAEANCFYLFASSVSLRTESPENGCVVSVSNSHVRSRELAHSRCPVHVCEGLE